MKKLLFIPILLMMVGAASASALTETGDLRAAPKVAYGKQSDGTVTAIQVDSDGKVVMSGTVSGSSSWSQSGTNVYDTRNNIGIGTSSPSEKLEVVGTLSATGVTATSVITPYLEATEIDGTTAIGETTRDSFEAVLQINNSLTLGNVPAYVLDNPSLSSLDISTSGNCIIGANMTVYGAIVTEGGIQGNGTGSDIVEISPTATISGDCSIWGNLFCKEQITVAVENPDISKFYYVDLESEVYPSGFEVANVKISADGTLSGNLTVTTGFRTKPSNATANPSVTTIEEIVMTGLELSDADDGSLSAAQVGADQQIGFSVPVAFDYRLVVTFIGRRKE